MAQRRTPSGQGPARRAGQPGRPAARTAGRSAGRDTATRLDPRASTSRAASRAPGTGRSAEATRSGSRPAAARRAAASGTTKRTVATRPRAFTSRATVLLVVLVVLALGYTYPVRVYLDQESTIGQLKAAQAAQRTVIAEKGEEIAKWQDDAYVKIQARKRLFYGDPGDVLLLVYSDPDGAARDAGVDPAASPAPDRWYDTLWSSIAAANAENHP